MTIEQALRILKLNDGKPTLEEIRYQYRILAKEYHPDLNKSIGSAEQFILLNAAYELLIKKRYFSDVSNGIDYKFYEDEVLQFRIKIITDELEKISRQYNVFFKQKWEYLQSILYKKIERYNSKGTLRNTFQEYYTTSVEGSITSIITWYNEQLDVTVDHYNAWIYNYMDKSMESLKKEESRYFFFSKAFNTIFFSNLSISALLIYFIDFAEYLPFLGGWIYFLILALAIIITIIMFKYQINNKYSRVKFQIDRNAFHLTPSMIDFNSIASKSLDTLTAGSISNTSLHVGALSGHWGLGLLTAVGGALINGAISLWNTFTDDSLSALKSKAADQCKYNLSLVNNMISTNLNEQLSEIKTNLFENIASSYNSAKVVLVKGYLQKTSSHLVEQYCNKEVK